MFQAMFADPDSSEFSAFLLLVLPVILYFALFEHSSWQATWGKRKMGLRVIDRHGARLSLPRSLTRSLLKFAPWELTHACLSPRSGRQSPILAEPFPGMAHVGLILDQREDIVAFETLAALKEG